MFTPTATTGASGSGIDTVIGGVAPDWGPFSALGHEGRILVEAVMAGAILICLGLAAWGAAKQRLGTGATRDAMSAEHGKSLIVAGLTGTFLVGSMVTLFTIVYGMAI